MIASLQILVFLANLSGVSELLNSSRGKLVQRLEFNAASEWVAAGKGDLTDPKQRVTEAEAIERAKQGEEAAFEILYQLHKRRVYSLCLRMVSNPSQAEDLAQEAFLQLFRKIGTFRGESAFSTWLHRMTVNVVLMQLRKKGLPLVSLEETLEADEEAPRKEFGADMAAAEHAPFDVPDVGQCPVQQRRSAGQAALLQVSEQQRQAVARAGQFGGQGSGESGQVGPALSQARGAAAKGALPIDEGNFLGLGHDHDMVGIEVAVGEASGVQAGQGPGESAREAVAPGR